MAIFENKTETAVETPAAMKLKSANLRSILVKPRISEKSAKSSQSGKYIFEVAIKSNKVEIRKAVEQTYQVKVVRVNIIRTEGKKRTYGGTSGKMSNFKKAIITLQPGQTIDTGESI